jgi:hypothetical protein
MRRQARQRAVTESKQRAVDWTKKKSPREAGLNPFPGGDGGDRFIMPKIIVHRNKYFVFSS